MRVVDLANDLEVPTSEVLQACQRLGIEATWAGAEVGAADAAKLHSEFASAASAAAEAPTTAEGSGDTPADTPADTAADDAAPTADADAGVPPEAGAPPPADPPVAEPTPPEPAAEGAAAVIPPTSAASMPGLIDEITPEPEPVRAATQGPLQSGTARIEATAPRPATTSADAEARRLRHFDRGVKSATIELVVALVLLVAANQIKSPWPIAALWLLALIALIVALVTAAKAWYRSSTHPEKIRGTWTSITLVVLASFLLVGYGLSAYVILRSTPAEDAPLDVGQLQSIDRLRWGRHRLAIMLDTGWKPPAKDVGTCWKDTERLTTNEVPVRRPHRVEYGNVRADCDEFHMSEVLAHWSVSQDSDDPYPGPAALDATYLPSCGDEVAEARAAALKGGHEVPALVARIERPTSTGWKRGDHDLTCVAVGQKIKGKIAS